MYTLFGLDMYMQQIEKMI